MQMCTGAFFVTAQIREYPQTIKLWHMHKISYNTTIKMNYLQLQANLSGPQKYDAE